MRHLYLLKNSTRTQKTLVCAGLLVMGSRYANAADFTVTNLNDAGAGSLRQALLDANTAAGADTINFAAGLTGTIPLSSGQLSITDAVTINGPGASALTLNGGGAQRQLFVNTSGTITIKGLTFTNGNPGNSSGGAILVADAGGSNPISIERCVFSGNQTNVAGGAVHSSRPLTILESEFTGNSAGTSGGAVSGYMSALTLRGCTIAGNTAQSAGGVNLLFGNNSVISQCTIHGNTASNGSGGGLATAFSTGVSIVNSTIANNTVGSAIFYGGGIHASSNSALTLTNTIVSGNVLAANPRDIDLFGASTVAGTNNLVGTNSTYFSSFTNGVNGNQIGTAGNPLNALLGALQDNGGPTRTRLPQTGSPAINAGAASALANDQRGAPFPRQVDAGVDIGAVEADLTPPTGTLSPVANVVDASPATLLQFDVVYTDNAAIIGASLGSGDVQVTGPNGFSALATFVSATPSIGGASVTATYSIVPPGGNWDLTDNGVYTVSAVANQVLDAGANAVAAGVLGYFKVGLNGPGGSTGGSAVTTTPGSGNTVTIGFNFANPPTIPLTVSVDFGDGTTGEPGPHTYANPGTYTVTVTVTGGGGSPLTFTTQVTVGSLSGGGNFRVRVSRITLGSSAGGTDTVYLFGVISVPSNINYAGKTIDVNVGGATQLYTLDESGFGETANGEIKIAYPRNKKKKNSPDAQQVNFKTEFTGAFAAAVQANTPKDDAGFPSTLPVTVLFNGQTYRQTLSVKFKQAKKGPFTRFGFF